MNIPNALKIVRFEPSQLKSDLRFYETGVVNGPTNNDGVSSFSPALSHASKLDIHKGRQLLFGDGLLSNCRTNIPGPDKILELRDRPLADPDLIWSLFSEVGQVNLRYLNEVFGVRWIEALRRTVVHGQEGSSRGSLVVRMKPTFEWECFVFPLSQMRSADNFALILGDSTDQNEYAVEDPHLE
ncbi:MAG: hypothetical protein K9M11_01015 [Candidatus Pacebacteria bacterium]|nr:hypothetical protein [Candidatus Paceibacterota bacterium]